ncbi:arylsulfatase [Flavobacterium sp. FlaQc-57]|uniref:arylsulfatase n=1 Tax=Flavobacterium sp. FlaQc-57 TaxID=3374186 RepID=UPI003758220B
MSKIWKTILVCLITSFVFAQQKPNIIYIYADDLGYGELGSYGQQKIKTPNLDKIANEGIKFTQHYAGAPVCAPSRCMLMTGKNSGHSYIRGNYELGGFEDENEGGQMPLPEGTFTIAKLMKQAGYTTGIIGKWGLGMNNTTGAPNKQGFDYSYGYLCQKQAHNFYPTHLWENGKRDTLNNPYIQVHKPLAKDAPDSAFDYFKGKEYSITKMAEKTFEFIKNNKKKPFFLYLPYTGPHVSLQAPDQAIKEYLGQFEEMPYRGEKGYASTLYPRSTYAAMITYMDKQVGEIMKLLKNLGLDENTIVMFSSDNGATFDVGGTDTVFFNSVAGLRGRKQDLYEGGIREPFIARWPGKIKKGTVTDHISAQFDLMATLSELTEIKVLKNDGISFLPTLLGEDNKQKKHDYLYFEFPEKGGQVAVRMGNWKGVKSNMRKNKNAPWEIYNLKTDEKETTDVASQNPELVIKFEKILKEEHQPSHLREWEFIEPKFQEN